MKKDLKYLRIFEEFDKQGNESDLDKFISWLKDKDFELYDGIESLIEKFLKVSNQDISSDEKADDITNFLDEGWDLGEGYTEVWEYLEKLFMEEN